MKLLLLITAAIILRLIYYFYYYFQAKYFYEKYMEYLSSEDNWFISDHRNEIIHMFKALGIKDSSIFYSENIGFGQVAQGKTYLFDNIQLKREDVVNMVNLRLRECIVISKNNLLHTFNPVRWIELVIFLPKYMLNYLGIKKDNFISKLMQVIWWILSFFAVISSVFFNNQFTLFIKGLFK